MKRPRSGIIETGFTGAVHARAVRAAGGVVSAVAASSRTRAEAMAATMGASRVSGSAVALIESDDVDVVHICTPNDLHASLGQQALAAGKHVICEKPLAASVEAAECLVDGAVGMLLASQVSPGRKNPLWFSLDGTDESVSFNQEQPDVLWVGTRSGTRIVPRGGLGCASGAEPLNLLPAGHPQGYQDAFTAFITGAYAAIDGAAPDGLPAFTDGLRAARLTAAVLESARSGDWQVIR
jgi:predicted dehydrogenase